MIENAEEISALLERASSNGWEVSITHYPDQPEWFVIVRDPTTLKHWSLLSSNLVSALNAAIEEMER